MRRLRLSLCVTTVMFGCAAPHQDDTASVAVEDALMSIEESRTAFALTVKEGRYQDLAPMVTADAITVGPGSVAWERMRKLGQDRGTTFPYDSIVMRPVETVIVSDTIAWDFGTSTVYFTNEGGEVEELRDTFLAILKRGPDGVWRLHREVASARVE